MKILLLLLKFAYAHPGGTDKYGCHTNSKTGQYHCHSKKTNTQDKNDTLKLSQVKEENFKESGSYEIEEIVLGDSYEKEDWIIDKEFNQPYQKVSLTDIDGYLIPLRCKDRIVGLKWTVEDDYKTKLIRS